MLIGALFWGLSADVVGRKWAFNLSLTISSVFAIVAGAAPNWIVLGFFVCLAAFGSGGNLVLDTAVFLEYIPSREQWLITLMAAWWGLGQLIAGLSAWAFLPNFSCSDAATCTYDNNKGWRYVWFANGAIVFVMSIARITVIRLKETPKFLVGEGKDAEVVETLQFIATKYNRPCSLTLELMQSCGETGAGKEHAKKRFSFNEVGVHLKGLFATSRLALSTLLIWFSWLLIGLAYPLYNVFLPTYLATRGASFGQASASVQWRNYAITNLCSIPSPILAGYMCKSRFFWGRRGAMVNFARSQTRGNQRQADCGKIIGALITMAFFFAYTQVRNNAQNVAFTCCISFCLVSSTSPPVCHLCFALLSVVSWACIFSQFLQPFLLPGVSLVLWTSRLRSHSYATSHSQHGCCRVVYWSLLAFRQCHWDGMLRLAHPSPYLVHNPWMEQQKNNNGRGCKMYYHDPAQWPWSLITRRDGGGPSSSTPPVKAEKIHDPRGSVHCWSSGNSTPPEHRSGSCLHEPRCRDGSAMKPSFAYHATNIPFDSLDGIRTCHITRKFVVLTPHLEYLLWNALRVYP